MKHFIAIVLIILPCTASSQSQQVPYTLEDRERLIRLEVSQEERFHALNEKIDAQGVSLTERIQAQGDALNKRIDEVQTFLLWGFGMTFTFMLGLVGFVLWDRRSYLKPVIADTRELADKEQRLLRTLKDYSKTDPKLADILRANGLM